MTSNTNADANAADADPEEGLDRRRLIRWVAALAFAVPVLVELFTFGNLLGNELLPADGDGAGAPPTASPEGSATAEDDAVGVGDELLPGTAASERITVSEVRGDPSQSQTYVLRVNVENPTEATVALRLTALRLRDGTTIDGVSSTGGIEPGDEGVVTGAWELPSDSMPAAVEVVATRDGETVVSRFVPLERPAVQG